MHHTKGMADFMSNNLLRGFIEKGFDINRFRLPKAKGRGRGVPPKSDKGSEPIFSKESSIDDDDPNF